MMNRYKTPRIEGLRAESPSQSFSFVSPLSASSWMGFTRDDGQRKPQSAKWEAFLYGTPGLAFIWGANEPLKSHNKTVLLPNDDEEQAE